MKAPVVALSVLLVLAVVFGYNIVAATSRFVGAFQAYDSLRLELVEFAYTDPQTPIPVTVRIHNPSDQRVEVMAIELRLDAGFKRVGGGETRTVPTSTADERARFTLEPHSSATFDLVLNISDKTYVTRLGTNDIDWRVTGRYLVKLDKDIEPEWINA